MTTTTSILILESITCGECCIPFALERAHLQMLKNSGDKFYCPNGHHINYTKSENQRLKDELAREKQRAEQREASLKGTADYYRRDRDETVRKLTAQKAAKTRLKNRIANGVCPCCTRSFENLQRHMTNQHPEFKQGTP